MKHALFLKERFSESLKIKMLLLRVCYWDLFNFIRNRVSVLVKKREGWT